MESLDIVTASTVWPVATRELTLLANGFGQIVSGQAVSMQQVREAETVTGTTERIRLQDFI